MLNLLGLTGQWLRTMAWHLWRIARGWPAYRAMSDTTATLLSFMVVYTVAAAMHLALLEDYPPLLAVAYVLVELGFNAALSIRPGRGRLLFNALLGASMLAHLMVLLLAPIAGNGVLTAGLAVVVPLYSTVRAFAVFRHLPAEVQAPGWRAK